MLKSKLINSADFQVLSNHSMFSWSILTSKYVLDLSQYLTLPNAQNEKKTLRNTLVELLKLNEN